MIRRFAQTAALGLGLGLASVAGAQTDAPKDGLEVTLSRDGARAMARRALDVGNPALAASIARQLLARNDQDLAALLLLTAGLSRSGQATEAVAFGRRAFALAPAGPQRFEAAFLTAEALSLADQPMAAKLWLRRADRFSPGEAQDAVLRDAFRKLDSRTPLRLNLAFAAGPSANVNGGSLHDTFWWSGIPFAIDEALPGFSASGQAKLSLRLPVGEDRAATVYVSAGHREVWLAQRAQEIDPDAKGSDYNSDALDFGATFSAKTASDLIWSAEARIGRRWYGSGLQSEGQKVSFGVAKAFAQSRSLSLELAAEATQYPARPVADQVRLSAEAEFWQPLGQGAVALSLGYVDVGSDAAGVAWRGASAGVQWRPAPLAKGVGLTLFSTVQVKDYWKTSTDADLAVDLGAAAKFSELSVMGFAPTATVTASRSYSDLVTRDTFDLSVALGISSTF